MSAIELGIWRLCINISLHLVVVLDQEAQHVCIYRLGQALGDSCSFSHLKGLLCVIRGDGYDEDLG